MQMLVKINNLKQISSLRVLLLFS